MPFPYILLFFYAGIWLFIFTRFSNNIFHFQIGGYALLNKKKLIEYYKYIITNFLVL